MRPRFFLRWTLNCAFGELAGIGIAGIIAYLVNSRIGEPQTFPLKLLVLFSMMIAGAIEGSLLGFFQWRVLKEKFEALPMKAWMGYTIAIAVLGWFLGMLPSLFFIPSEPVAGGEQAGVDLDQPWLFAALSMGAGVFLGALFGLFQWIPFRKYAQKAGQWILANALGWGLGLGWIYLFASLPEEGASLAMHLSAGITGGVLAGLSVGVVTGLFLQKIEPR